MAFVAQNPLMKKIFRANGSAAGGLWTTGTVLVAAAATLASASAFVDESNSKMRPSQRRWGVLVGDLPPYSSSPFMKVTSCKAAESFQSSEAWVKDDEIPFQVEKSDSHYYERMDPPERSEAPSHVIFGQLLKPNLIEQYHIYRRVNVGTSTTSSSEVVVATVRFGTNLDGHSGIVHGGVISLLLDDAMGFAYEAIGIPMAFTANLTVNFRKPVPAGVSVVVRVHVARREGRKVYFDAQVTSPDGSIRYVEGSSLYIIPRTALKQNAIE